MVLPFVPFSSHRTRRFLPFFDDFPAAAFTACNLLIDSSVDFRREGFALWLFLLPAITLLALVPRTVPVGTLGNGAIELRRCSCSAAIGSV